MLYTITVDIQFLLGLILWFVGPFKITNAGALMSSPLARFYIIEHPLLMLVGPGTGCTSAAAGRVRPSRTCRSTGRPSSSIS